MAKYKDANYKDILEKIEKEKITVHPFIWKLIDKYVRDDVFSIRADIWNISSRTPNIAVKGLDSIFSFVAKIFSPRRKTKRISEIEKEILEKTDQIESFLNSLKDSTLK